jgi:hypothetical protein
MSTARYLGEEIDVTGLMAVLEVVHQHAVKPETEKV